MIFNKFLKFVKISWAIFGYVYIDNGVFQKKTHKQQQHFVIPFVCLLYIVFVCLNCCLYFYFFLLPLVVNKDVQKVMLRVAGPHDFIHSKIEEKTRQQRYSVEFTRTLRLHVTDKLVTEL